MPLVPAKFRVTLVFTEASTVKDCLTLELFVLSSLFVVFFVVFVFAAGLWFFCHFRVHLFRLFSFISGLLGLRWFWRARLLNLHLTRRSSCLLWLLLLNFWPSWNYGLEVSMIPWTSVQHTQRLWIRWTNLWFKAVALALWVLAQVHVNVSLQWVSSEENVLKHSKFMILSNAG